MVKSKEEKSFGQFCADSDLLSKVTCLQISCTREMGQGFNPPVNRYLQFPLQILSKLIGGLCRSKMKVEVLKICFQGAVAITASDEDCKVFAQDVKAILGRLKTFQFHANFHCICNQMTPTSLVDLLVVLATHSPPIPNASYDLPASLAIDSTNFFEHTPVSAIRDFFMSIKKCELVFSPRGSAIGWDQLVCAATGAPNRAEGAHISIIYTPPIHAGIQTLLHDNRLFETISINMTDNLPMASVMNICEAALEGQTLEVLLGHCISSEALVNINDILNEYNSKQQQTQNSSPPTMTVELNKIRALVTADFKHDEEKKTSD